MWRSVEFKREFAVSYTRYVTTLVALAWISTVFNLLLAAVMIAVPAQAMLLECMLGDCLLLVWC